MRREQKIPLERLKFRITFRSPLPYNNCFHPSKFWRTADYAAWNLNAHERFPPLVLFAFNEIAWINIAVPLPLNVNNKKRWTYISYMYRLLDQRSKFNNYRVNMSMYVACPVVVTNDLWRIPRIVYHKPVIDLNRKVDRFFFLDILWMRHCSRSLTNTMQKYKYIF